MNRRPDERRMKDFAVFSINNLGCCTFYVFVIQHLFRREDAHNRSATVMQANFVQNVPDTNVRARKYPWKENVQFKTLQKVNLSINQSQTGKKPKEIDSEEINVNFAFLRTGNV